MASALHPPEICQCPSPGGCYLAELGCRPPKPAPFRDLGLLLHVAFCPAVRGRLEPDAESLSVLMKEGPPSGVTLKGAQSLTGRWKGGEEGEGRAAGHTPVGGQHRSAPRNRARRTQGPRTVSTRLAWLSCGALPVWASRGGGRGSPGGPALLSMLFVLGRLDRHVLTMEQPQGGRNR